MPFFPHSLMHFFFFFNYLCVYGVKDLFPIAEMGLLCKKRAVWDGECSVGERALRGSLET